MSKKIQSTYDEYVAKLSPKEKKEFEEERRELIISEMICAAMEKDDITVRKLAKMANVAPGTVQNLRSGISNAAVGSLFKIFKSLGYSIVAEKGDEKLPLVVPDVVEARVEEEEVSITRNYAPRLARRK